MRRSDPVCMSWRLAALYLASALCAVPALAQSATGLNLRPLLTTFAEDPSEYAVGASATLSGVAKLVINNSTRCSGALVGNGSYILTAAHCVANNSATPTATSVSVTFDAALGSPLTSSVTSAQSRVFLAPDWTGDFRDGADVALIKLPTPVLGATSYDIAESQVGFPSLVTVAGYGRFGNGLTGHTGPPPGEVVPLLVGTNTYDRFWPGSLVAGSPYLFDFDDGTDTHNLTGDSEPTDREVMLAPGDSGGPSFIELLGGDLAVVGVHSFGGTTGQPVDLDDKLNSTFGELGGDVNVPLLEPWITSVIAVPEPQAYILMLVGLLFVVAQTRTDTRRSGSCR